MPLTPEQRDALLKARGATSAPQPSPDAPGDADVKVPAPVTPATQQDAPADEPLCPRCFKRHAGACPTIGAPTHPAPVPVTAGPSPSPEPEEVPDVAGRDIKPTTGVLEGRVVYRMIGRQKVPYVVRDGELVPQTPLAPATVVEGTRASIVKETATRIKRTARAKVAETGVAELDKRPRGENADGEKMFDVVLAMSESQRAEFAAWLASAQRSLGTRGVAHTILAALPDYKEVEA